VLGAVFPEINPEKVPLGVAQLSWGGMIAQILGDKSFFPRLGLAHSFALNYLAAWNRLTFTLTLTLSLKGEGMKGWLQQLINFLP